MKSTYSYNDVPIIMKNISFIKSLRDKGFTYRENTGRYANGFFFVHSGSIRYDFYKAGGKIDRRVWKRGDCYYIPEGTPYKAVYTEDGTELYIANFSIREGSMPSEFREPLKLPIYDAERVFFTLFDPKKMGATFEARSFFGMGRIYTILFYAINSLAEASPKYARLVPALEEINRRYEVQQKISYYADLCGMSETGFRRLFKEYTGLSPVDYRNRLRLEQADRLIATGEYLVEEAALSVGFTNQSFFCREYRKMFGHSPLGKE